jgi:hypothetical protein
VVELLHKAIEWRRQLDTGELQNQAEIARREGMTRARVTQVMGMLRLPPEIQHEVLAAPHAIRRPAITERTIRPLTQIKDRKDQRDHFQKLIGG